MARWQRIWLVSTLVYITPLLILMLSRPAYLWWQNGLVVAGPPAAAFVVAWCIWGE